MQELVTIFHSTSAGKFHQGSDAHHKTDQGEASLDGSDVGKADFCRGRELRKALCLGQSEIFGGGWLSWEMVWWIEEMIAMRISQGEKTSKWSYDGDKCRWKEIFENEQECVAEGLLNYWNKKVVEAVG